MYFFEYAQNFKTTNYPWRAIFTSKPVWAIFNEYFSHAWLTSFIIYCLPLYINGKFQLTCIKSI